MDQGETGMKQAALEQWLAFRTMIAFARGADRGKPTWVLTYGYQPRDSSQSAGLVLAEGANFYETKGPQMAETVDLRHRTDLFRWIADNESAFYASESLAHVALLYSPRTRDLVDTCSGQPYDAGDSVHFAAYRATANHLYQAHIPFDIVIDDDTAAFGHYRVLIAPEVQAMSRATAAALADFSGLLVTIGRSGLYDEWLRPLDALAGVQQHNFARLTRAAIPLVNTGLLMTDAPASVQFGLRGTRRGYILVLVNTARRRTRACWVELRLPSAERIRRASLDIFGSGRADLPFVFAPESKAIEVKIPAGIDTVALLSLSKRTPPAGSRMARPRTSELTSG